MDPETSFFSGLLELQYGQDVEKKLKVISEKVKWAQGWPDNDEAFWNAEAFMWQHKIKKEKRALIKNELVFLHGGRNLDLGCGAYSYLPSVGFDFSEKMLQFNDNCHKKVQGDLEENLPFTNEEFSSVTAVFVLNYVQNYEQLLLEIKRVLKLEGTFVIVLFKGKLNAWQRQKEVQDFSLERWQEILQGSGFRVNFYEKEKLGFFKCKK